MEKRKFDNDLSSASDTSSDLRFEYSDGGRSEAGFKGEAQDCVCRAIAIVSGVDYKTVYDMLNEEAKSERPRTQKRSSARTGVHRRSYQRVLEKLGFEWVCTKRIGDPNAVHMRADELPKGAIIARLSRHLCAVVDHVVFDTHDPCRDGTRLVYGYFRKAEG